MPDPANSPPPARHKLIAHTLPMLLFVVLLGLNGVFKETEGTLWRTAPEFWIYPLQTLLSGVVLLYFRREYQFQQLHRPILTIVVALFVFVSWIAPQQFFGFAPRVLGFNLDTFADQPSLYWVTLAIRFLRLVLVVPCVEEVFWRGFLLRSLIAEKFALVPFGTFSWLSFIVVTVAFCFSHARADWPAALIAGALYNIVAYRTRSLTSCLVAHSLTNLALGLWIIATRQWGFW